jgi:hypothetical protein
VKKKPVNLNTGWISFLAGFERNYRTPLKEPGKLTAIFTSPKMTAKQIKGK